MAAVLYASGLQDQTRTDCELKTLTFSPLQRKQEDQAALCSQHAKMIGEAAFQTGSDVMYCHNTNNKLCVTSTTNNT